jgi:hypothetical protein
MNNISEEHDILWSDLCQENLEHPLLLRIDIWEQESIKKIQTAAQTARAKWQQIFNRKKDEIKSSIEHLTDEIRFSQESANYTESDISKWMEKLTTLRKTLQDCSTIDMIDDNQAETMIRLIKICDEQDQQPRSIVQPSEQYVQMSKELPCLDEKFDKIDSDVVLSEENLIATCGSKRTIVSNRFIYGVNRYSSGKHSVHFSIEKQGEAPLFLGIITSSKKYDQSFFSPNNSSVYGWYNIESFVISGKSQAYNEEIVLTTGDELTLTLDCQDQKILLQHQRTKRIFSIPVKLEKCPFPWKIMVGLSNYNDCIRIIK